MVKDFKAILGKYHFTDQLGHPLENCVDYQELLRVAAVAEHASEMLTALRCITAMTDADDPNSYRSDSGEDCLDAVYAAAREVVLKVSAEGERNG